ncbi:MAG: hypothetical protein LBK95_04755 [Bifidobacteriaceae bacterium]|jgi:hypothetical protein|nr:hypothetical protein [Bifidobacteriaceae bacterium]
MAIPAKPTVKLTVDGIVGQKTRDAAAWAFYANSFTTGTALSAFPQQLIKGLQIWLNRYGYWKFVAPSGSQANLVLDGLWGNNTSYALGGSIAYLCESRDSQGYLYQGCKVNGTEAGKAAISVKALQALLNGIIFRDKPVGPYFFLVNVTPTFSPSGYTGNRTWAVAPGPRYALG